jgi:hypothetical protein
MDMRHKLFKIFPLQMLLKGYPMMRLMLSFFALAFLLTSSIALAQNNPLQEKENVFIEIKDYQGQKLQGYLQLDPDEITVSTKDNQEKSIPLKLIESIKVEKIPSGLPGAEPVGEESYYSVRLKNSQEIFKLRKKFTFSLSTDVGVITRTIDPEMAHESFQKDLSPATDLKSEPSFIRDKNVIFSLEIKF